MEKQINFHYSAGLDPWLKNDSKSIEHLIKLSLLTTQHVVISDNQALNCQGLQEIFRQKSASDFFSTPHKDNLLPIIISLRNEVNNFEEVLKNLLLEREFPPIFPWMSSHEQYNVDLAYRGTRIKTLGPLFDITGSKFQNHVVYLNKLIESQPSSVFHWKGLPHNYPSLVEKAANKLISSLQKSTKGIYNKNLLAACSLVLKEIEKGSQANRSNLFRKLQQKKLDSKILKTISLKLLDEPYHLNFAGTGPYHLTTGSEYSKVVIDESMTRIGQEINKFVPEEIFEVDGFPLTIEQIPYERLTSIRNNFTFDQLITTISTGTQEIKICAMRDLLNMVCAECSKEPSSLKKISKLRLKALIPPNSFRDHLEENGLTMADIASIAGKAGGFIAGETVGQLVGIFGVGGLAGATSAILVEQLAYQKREKTKKRDEFQQMIHLLLDNKK